MKDYVKSYIALAAYILLTTVGHLNFWQIEGSARPIWLAGAIVVLLAVVFVKRAPGQRSRRV